MTDASPLRKRAARFQGLMKKYAEGDKKDPAKARHYRKLMKRCQRRSLSAARQTAKVAAKAAEKAKNVKPAAAPAVAPAAETKS